LSGYGVQFPTPPQFQFIFDFFFQGAFFHFSFAHSFLPLLDNMNSKDHSAKDQQKDLAFYSNVKDVADAIKIKELGALAKGMLQQDKVVRFLMTGRGSIES
jgi:hypothetical protein